MMIMLSEHVVTCKYAANVETLQIDSKDYQLMDVYSDVDVKSRAVSEMGFSLGAASGVT